MNKLTSILIENIKGIESKTFDLALYPNKPSILVAPNGFGKSSIACAFNSLNNSRIALDEKNAHLGNTSLQPKIEIMLDSDNFQATDSSNTISGKFDISVINSPIYAKASNRNMGRFSTSSASLQIAPVVLIDTIPVKQDFEYSAQSYKSAFGDNGKILPNAATILANKEFIYQFDKKIDKQRFSKVKIYKDPITIIRNKINQQSGTADFIKQWIAHNHITELRAITPLKELAELISNHTNDEEVDSYLLAYQIVCLTETTNFRKAVNYQIYLKDKLFFDDLLKSTNSTRHKIKTQEVKQGNKKKLEVSFPSADEVSNGQRDILSFIAQVQKAKRKFSKKHCLLIIDEVFDYLDDANLVAFQYYVTLLIEEFKEQGRLLYPILLTHLDPSYFNHFCFNNHKLQIRYLAKSTNNLPSTFLKLVQCRENPSIKDFIEIHHFHYHPTEKDLESEFQTLQIKKAWGKSHEFYKLINAEMQKYLCDESYDPIGVLLAVRIKIEQLAYQELSASQQIKFIETHKTRNKLDYCSSECGVEIPETHYLLGIIYNDALHWRDCRDYETPLYSKLGNSAIKRMIQTLSLSKNTPAFNSSANDQTINTVIPKVT